MYRARIAAFATVASLLSLPLARADLIVPEKDVEIDATQEDVCVADGAAVRAEIGFVGGKDALPHRFLLHYDLSRIPEGADLTKANLVLFVEEYTSAASSFRIFIERLLNPTWEESEATWMTYSCDTQNQVSIPHPWCNTGGDFSTGETVPWNVFPSFAGTQQAIDILPLARAAVNEKGGQLHILLRVEADETEQTLERFIRVPTREEGGFAQPLLDITWTGDDPPKTGWVEFRDETATRLIAATTGPEGTNCSPPSETASWMSCDEAEKDIAVGDFDDDGDQDIMVVRKFPFSDSGPRRPVILLNDDGVLRDVSAEKFVDAAGNPVTPAATDARDVFYGDLDGDSIGDLVVANTCEQLPSFYQNRGGRCESWEGFTSRGDWNPPSFSSSGKRFCAVWGGDVDGDGDMDLYLSNYETTCTGDSEPISDVLLINDIQGTQQRFVDETAVRLGTPLTPTSLANVSFGTAVEMHDLDGGGTEIIKITTLGTADVAPFHDNDVYILRNDGSGGFLSLTDPATDKLDVPSPYMFTAGKLNGDELYDFYVVDDGQDTVHIATSPLSFVTSNVSSPRTGGFGGNVKLADIDRDGDPDVGVADVDVDIPPCLSERRFALLRNDGSGGISDPFATAQNFHVNAYDFAFLDINGDSCPDLFLGLCSGYKVLIQDCQGN